ncbi:outer membrane lipoprotein [Syntrophus gentianae]|uniref:Outer membrane lipoprotein n=1 Tax=Syntrophus gentianae TaxID=43775 RepID=A0A1H7ZCH4_9BACT|nr:Slp family lipoprotein [Syntrophus gentianae]SEM55965.1 outer membrane lipoprotein [Syntrophus gentianae]
MKKSLILALLSFVLLAACAPFSQKLLKEAEPDVSLSDVQKDPERYRGRMVIWGGIVIETLNRKSETVLKVMQTDLDFQKRPTNAEKSSGRFLARYEGFLDPYIYSKGREITVAGVIIGKEEQKIGENRYVYPIVDSRQIHLWEKRQEIRYYDPWLWGPPYGWGYPYPWGPGYPYWW